MPLFFAQETNLHQNTDGVYCITYSMGVHWEEGGKKTELVAGTRRVA
jgi:hypothetical protein